MHFNPTISHWNARALQIIYSWSLLNHVPWKFEQYPTVKVSIKRTNINLHWTLTTLQMVHISRGPPLVQLSTLARVKLPFVSPNETACAATLMVTFCDMLMLFLVFITAVAMTGAPSYWGLLLHVLWAIWEQICWTSRCPILGSLCKLLRGHWGSTDAMQYPQVWEGIKNTLVWKQKQNVLNRGHFM